MINGKFGATSQGLGNTTLVKYGIFEDTSDIHIHVSPPKIYVFKTNEGKRLAGMGVFTPRQVKTGEIVTAIGYAIGLDYFNNLEVIKIPPDVYWEHQINETDSTSIKGQKAVSIAKEMVQRGLISFKIETCIIDDKKLQISGLDVVAKTELKIQVKCDLPVERTGRIYIQTHECNPFKQI